MLAETRSMEAGRLLRSARVKAGLTLTEVASRLFVSESLVSRWESGTRKARPGFFALVGGAILAEQYRTLIEVGDARSRRTRPPEIVLGLPDGMTEEEARRACVAALARLRQRPVRALAETEAAG